MDNNQPKRSRVPVMVALAVAIFGMLAMLVVDHGPWSRSGAQAADTAHYGTAGVPAPGPKPAQPANPVAH